MKIGLCACSTSLDNWSDMLLIRMPGKKLYPEIVVTSLRPEEQQILKDMMLCDDNCMVGGSGQNVEKMST